MTFSQTRQPQHDPPARLNCKTARRPSSRRSATKGLRQNKKYNEEEIDFIVYSKVDRKIKWEEIVELFHNEFASRAEVERKDQGLQAVFYRANKELPVLADDGLCVYEKKDGLWVQQIRDLPVRKQDGTKFGLMKRYPERAMQYSWVHEDDKRKYSDLGESTT